MASGSRDPDIFSRYHHLMDLIYGAFKSKTIFAACELGIFDSLSGGKSTAKELSGKLSTDETATTQLLDTLVSLELVEKDGCNEEAQRYSNTKTAEKFLVKASDDSMIDFIAHLNASFKLFDNLAWAVREGGNQWHRVSGSTSSDLNPFNSFYATDEAKMRFLGAMKVSCHQDASRFLSAFDLGGFNHMCDLGGCTGDISHAACEIYPEMKITVLDLPPVVALSHKFRPPIHKSPNQKNVSFLAGDFFIEDLPTADLYVLVRIIHDWDEKKINLLLSRIFKSLPSGGGLLIGEMLRRDESTVPGLIANIRSLMMLTLCSRGARERSSFEYKKMLEAHGFVQIETKITQGVFLDAIFARKP